MRRKYTILATVIAVGLGAGLASAQAIPPGARIAAIEFEGAARIDTGELTARSGLQVGSSVTARDLDAAVQRLGQTGLFSSVSYRYRYTGVDLTVTFVVAEAAAPTGVVFDNFPWFTDEELRDAVARVVPGFGGKLPDNPDAVDRVREALTQALLARHLAGSVEYMPHLDMRTHQRMHLFKVAGVRLPICAVNLTGVQPSLLGGASEAARPLVQRDYSRLNVQEFLQGSVVPFYRRLGYLRVHLEQARASIGPVGSGCEQRVVIAVPIEEGIAYAWKGARWSGAQALTAEQLNGLLNMKDGAVADGTKIDEGLDKIRKAYGRQGYLMQQSEPAPRFDDGAGSVVFDVTVSEGPQFRMGQFEIAGAPEQVMRRLAGRWKLKPGDVFDEKYASEFLIETRKADPGLLQGLTGAKMSFKAETATRTVTVSLTFGS